MGSVVPADLSITQASALIHSGELSPIRLLESCLDRIAALEGTLRAWVTVDEAGARAAAVKLEAEATQQRWRSPLHGIPIGIKDIFDVAGLRTTANSRSLADNFVHADAESVARLRQAGAVILGKTATAEFAFLDPPPTCNPWNHAHTPGGSSSGSAAAVAAGMCLGALGTQTGGSTIRPAAYCGIVGYKPTFGSISCRGVIALAETLDHVGIFGRAVQDVAFMLEAMAQRPIGTTPTTQRPPRLAWLVGHFIEKASEPVAADIRRIATLLESAGAVVHQVQPPSGIDNLAEVCLTIIAAEAAEAHSKWFPQRRDLYGTRVREMLDRGLGIRAFDYLVAQRTRHQFTTDTEKLLAEADALLLPPAPAPAPVGLASTGDFTFNSPWTMCGLPSITIPSGLAGGLPLGMQLVGARGEDRRLLEVARWCERVLDTHLIPPLNGSRTN